MKSCFFIGHREADELLFPRMELVIDRLIREERVRCFYVGRYGEFDRLAAATVKRLRQKYPDITLMLVLPYHPAEQPTEAPEGFDGTYHPDGLENTPRRYAIVRTNHIMVDNSDWLVCYVRHGASNSRNLLEYAKRQEEKGLIRVVNIGENEAVLEPGRNSQYGLNRNRQSEANRNRQQPRLMLDFTVWVLQMNSAP